MAWGAQGSIVIYRKQLGDVIVLQPALRALIEQTGTVDLITFQNFGPLIELMPGVMLSQTHRFAIAERMVSFSPKPSAGLRRMACWVTRASVVLTKQRQRQWWHSILYDEVLMALTSDRYRGRAFFEAVAQKGQIFQPPGLTRPPAEWHPAGLPERYVVIHATSAWRRKCLSPARWGEVMQQISADRVGSIVITGGAAEWEGKFCAEVADCLQGHRVIDLSGKTTLRGYLSILARASAVFCIDSSAAHAAAAFSVPVLTLFGPSDPLHWHCPAADRVALSPDLGSALPDSGLPADAIPVSRIVAEVEALISALRC